MFFPFSTEFNRRFSIEWILSRRFTHFDKAIVSLENAVIILLSQFLLKNQCRNRLLTVRDSIGFFFFFKCRAFNMKNPFAFETYGIQTNTSIEISDSMHVQIDISQFNTSFFSHVDCIYQKGYGFSISNFQTFAVLHLFFNIHK